MSGRLLRWAKFLSDLVRSSSQARIPFGLAGALVLIVAVESYIDGHKLDMMLDTTWSYELSRKIASEHVKNCDLLVLGDSLASFGVAVSVIEEKTGLEGFNLAYPGMQAPGSYYLLREALKAGARPKFVLVDFFPDLLAADPWHNVINYPALASSGDCVELAYLARDPRLLGALLVRKFLPSLRGRQSIRIGVMDALQGVLSRQRTHNLALTRNREINRGLAISIENRAKTTDLNKFINQYFSQFSCKPINQNYLDRFMKLAADYDVAVVLLLPPYLPELETRLEATGFDAEHRKFVQTLVRRYPGLSVLDASRSHYDAEVFVDPDHLGYEGALAFSAEIGQALGARINGSTGSEVRWVNLPAYRRHSTKIRHETLEESRLAVSRNHRF